MQIILSRTALLTAAKQVKAAVEKRNTIPTLEHALLQVADGRATLRATDLDIEITAPLSVRPEDMQPGTITLPAHMLHDIVNKLAADAQVTLALDKGGGRATLKAGRSRFALPILEPADFPSLDAGEPTFSFELAGPALLGALERVAFAISTEETRYYLMGVYMHLAPEPFAGGEGARLRFVATDGHRLALAELPAPNGSVGLRDIGGLIIPAKTVARIRDLGRDAASIVLSGSTSKIKADFGGPIVVSKLIDGTYPDYARVIPTASGKQMEIERAALAAGVDRVTTLSSERGNAVRFAFADNRLTLTVINPDSGEAVEEIECPCAEPDLIIGFNGRYVQDALGNLGGEKDGRVEIALQDPGSPAVLRAAGVTDSLTVLMPMRV